MQKFCLALDLKNDSNLITAYEKYHTGVWPGIKESIFQSGITGMEIYRVENRLFMIIEATDDFSFEKKAAMDNGNEQVKKWDELMWIYQQPLPTAAHGEKWMLMNKIFELKQQ
jgi:L-rhamnose mutarotase